MGNIESFDTQESQESQKSKELWPRLDFENNSRGYITLFPLKEIIRKDISEVDTTQPKISIHFYEEKDAYNLYFAIYKWNCYWFYVIGSKNIRQGECRPDSTKYLPKVEKLDLIYQEGLNFFETWNPRGNSPVKKRNIEIAYILFANHFYNQESFQKDLQRLFNLKEKFNFSPEKEDEVFGYKSPTKDILNLSILKKIKIN